MPNKIAVFIFISILMVNMKPVTFSIVINNFKIIFFFFLNIYNYFKLNSITLYIPTLT